MFFVVATSSLQIEGLQNIEGEMKRLVFATKIQEDSALEKLKKVRQRVILGEYLKGAVEENNATK